MKFRIQSKNFGDERVIKHETIKRKYHYASHIHQYAELVIPKQGTVLITVDGNTEALGVGSAALIFPCQVHSYSSEEYNELDIFVLSPSLIPELLSGINGLIGDRAVFTLKKTSLDALKRKIIDNENYGVLELKGVIYLFISDYINSVNLNKSIKRYNLSVGIVKYISENFSERITLNDIASKLGYTPSYITSEIQSFFGDNLATLVSAIRIDKSINELCHTDLPCSEIALKYGFGSERSFYRQFKSIMGYTPTDYRRRAVISKNGTPFIRKEF